MQLLVDHPVIVGFGSVVILPHGTRSAPMIVGETRRFGKASESI